MSKTPFRQPIFLIAILFSTSILNGCFDASPIVKNVNTETFQGPELHVVSFNMLHPGPIGSFSEFNGMADVTFTDRMDILRNEILTLLPDVVILQEVSDTGQCRYGNALFTLVDDLNAALEDMGISYNSVYSVSNRDPIGITGFKEGNSILSRYEIFEVGKTIFQVQSRTVIKESRSALRVTISGIAGNIDIVGTHLSGDVAAENVIEIVDEILPSRGNDNPVIVAGDYNRTPDSMAVQHMLDGGFTDTWDEANQGEDGFTSGRDSLTDPSSMQTKRIDYLFVSNDCSILSTELFLDEAVDIEPGSEESWLFDSDHTGLYSIIIPAGY